MLAPQPLRADAMSMVPRSSQLSHSIKRRPTLKRSIDETSSMEFPSSPTKRSRVTFDADVEILSADDDEDLDPLVVKEQVRRAISRHLLRDDEAFDKIVSTFSASPDREEAPSSKALKIHLQAIIANISHLTRDCSGLVHAILNSEWIGRDESYFTLFVKFLGNLAAAQSGYIGKIMQTLIGLLGPQKTRRLSDAKPVRQVKIHRRVLQTIQYITQLVPTASGALARRMCTKLDFDFEKADERMTYIKNFMELVKYVPELTSEILDNVLKQLIKLDTAVQADLDDEEEDAEDEILQHMSTSQTLAQDMLRGGVMDDEDEEMSTSDESDAEDEEDLDPQAQRRKKLKDDVKQVDMIMDILFQYYSRLTTSTSLQTRDSAIEQLLSQFHNLILPRYRSRHPQFLIFHFAQSDPITVDRFVTSCVARLFNPDEKQSLRHTAAAYFSGFVGRGKHVSPSIVQMCINLLCDQLNALRKAYEPTCRGPDVKRYGDFYATFQAIMYIFCFRYDDIGSSVSDIDDESDIVDDENATPHDYDFPETLREALHTAIYSRLNPLRVCTPAIVEQFAKVTWAVRFMYIHTKIEENKRVRIAPSWHFPTADSDLDIGQVSRDTSWIGDDGMLEGYFPYDPYHLPMSRHWIENDYVEWQGLPGDVEETDSDSDDEDDMFPDGDGDSNDDDENEGMDPGAY